MYQIVCIYLDINALTWRKIVDLISKLDMLRILKVSIANDRRSGGKKNITSITPKEQALETILKDFRLKSIAKPPKSNFFY